MASTFGKVTLPNKGLDWLEMFQKSRNLPCLSATQDQENLPIRHKGIRTSHIRQTLDWARFNKGPCWFLKRLFSLGNLHLGIFGAYWVFLGSDLVNYLNLLNLYDKII